MPGCELTAYIRAWHDQNGGLSDFQAARVVLRIARALGPAHREGLVHRDLKPSNILIAHGSGGSDGELRQTEIRFADFGIGAAVKSSTATGDKTTISILRPDPLTPRYASPEQSSDPPAAADTRDDIYALGMIWCELISGPGKTMVNHLTLRQFGMSRRSLSILEACRATERRFRIADAAALDRRLTRLLRRGPVPRAMAIALAVLLGGTVAVTAASLDRMRSEEMMAIGLIAASAAYPIIWLTSRWRWRRKRCGSTRVV